MGCRNAVLRFQPIISAALAWLITLQCFQAPGVAQESTLEVAILAGENFRNDTDTPRTWEVAVRVQDRNGNRIKGAAVYFQIPDGYGTFAGDVSGVTVMTDDDGVARVRGFKRGKLAAAFIITVSASYQGMRGSASIHQVNIREPVMSPPHKALIIGGVLAAVGAVAVAATRNNSKTSVTLGNGTVTPRQ